MDNLRWMYESSYDFNGLARWMAVHEGHAEDDVEADAWFSEEHLPRKIPSKSELVRVSPSYDGVMRSEAEYAEEISKRDDVIARLRRRLEEAEAERDNLARDLDECNRDRERWRAECGMMLDSAQEIHRIAAAAEVTR